ncbi:hypothetical protein BDR26DRAFT_849175 [Obelidium mucronatum]|nr:hypothetical protein BDR26DRAFT_849175 [Obelidium mucronatum]
MAQPPLPLLSPGIRNVVQEATRDLSSSSSNCSVIDDLEDSYAFPKGKLRRVMQDPNKIPLVLVACGSYSPVTYLHLRMFEMAKDHIEEHKEFELMGAYFSPVSSGYKKAGLAYYKHRVRMCQLAVTGSDWIDVDPWEAGQVQTQRTAVVLQHFDDWLNGAQAGEEWGVKCGDRRRRIRIKLVAGGDLIQSFASYEVRNGEKIPVWLPSDVRCFFLRIQEFLVPDVHDFLLSHQSLRVYVVKQFIYNDISSTKVHPVIEYILRKRLYMVDEPSGRTDGPFDNDEEFQRPKLGADENLEDPHVEVVQMDEEEAEAHRKEELRRQGLNED